MEATVTNSVKAFALDEYEVRYVRKQVRYLMTEAGMTDWRANRARWMAEWPVITQERLNELDTLAATFVRPRVK